jgi:hypothetical protein
MPKFEIAEKDPKEALKTAVKATFEKREDYKTVVLVGDKLNKPRMLHKIQADKLIGLKRATEVKEAKLSQREEETVVTVVKKD